KGMGDEVFAGTMNGTGLLHVRVERPAEATVMARIVALVEEASATKARRQLFIETVEQRYSLAVVVATLALVAVPLALGGEFGPTLLRAMTFMIVASPCAVVLATMPPLLSAVANAGRHGVLVKSSVAMEQLADTTIIAFDKTGTLTTGAPTVTDVCPLDGWTGGDALALAAGAEAGSEHPLGRAVVTAARQRGVTVPIATRFSAQPGRGVTALVGGQEVTVGSPELLDLDGDDPAVHHVILDLELRGRTAVVVTVDARPVAVIGLADQARAGARNAANALTALTCRSPVLLTGDNRHAARHLATEVGITDVHAELLPADKVARVGTLAGDGHVTVVGDGINDAPMLAAAGTGIAMGRSGSDLTLDTADVVLVRDDLAAVAAVIDLSRRARRVIVQNLAFAVVVIVTLVGLDLAGHLPLPLGVAGHETSTVLVGLNGLRLLSRRAWKP
ncbi:MAG TPA: heavy metal translocating P-type ATPase, partial [Acidimicrobiales bacterium]|nr:heavy metal translocating P-type ATPase [Acidimicrobiales bacterium]